MQAGRQTVCSECECVGGWEGMMEGEIDGLSRVYHPVSTVSPIHVHETPMLKAPPPYAQDRR